MNMFKNHALNGQNNIYRVEGCLFICVHIYNEQSFPDDRNISGYSRMRFHEYGAYIVVCLMLT